MKQSIGILVFIIFSKHFSCLCEQSIIDYQLDEDIFPLEQQWDLETLAPCGLGYDYKLSVLDVVQKLSLDPAIKVLEINYEVENIGIVKGSDFYDYIQASGISSWWVTAQQLLYPGASVHGAETIWVPTSLFEDPTIQIRLITNGCDVDTVNNAFVWSE